MQQTGLFISGLMNNIISGRQKYERTDFVKSKKDIIQ